MSDPDLTIDQLVDLYSYEQINRRDFFAAPRSWD